MTRLSVVDHSRDASQMRYVYPVVSRRAGGVSVGINLSPNDACNFRCIYCQVPGLTRGVSPAIDLDLLADELQSLLTDILHGKFFEERVPEGARVLKDVAFSGNGEPTSSPDFEGAVSVVEDTLRRFGLLGQLPVVVITNGTLLSKPAVVPGIEALARIGGRVWFKLDGVTREAFERINATPLDPAAHLSRLRETAARIPTWIQTCLFAVDGEGPTDQEREAYLETLSALNRDEVPLKGVLLYGLARPSQQPEAPRLSALPAEEMNRWARGIAELGFDVQVSL